MQKPLFRRTAMRVALLALAAILLGSPAQAYIGPGAGITMLGALWGVIAAIGVALFSLVLWPLRALLRKSGGRRRQGVTLPSDR